LLLVVTVLFGVHAARAAGFSTFFQENCTIQALGHDAAGNLYVLGVVEYSPIPSHGEDLFVAKLNSTATELAYFIYLGGSGADEGTAMAVDSNGNAYITGNTNSPDFPVTSGPSPTNSQLIPFLTKLNPDGVVLNSTLFAGQAPGRPAAIAVDSLGNAYITGLLTTSAQGQPFVAKVDPTGSKLLFSTPGIGGSSIALGASGDIFIAGNLPSNGTYPTTAGAIQTSIVFNISCSGLICFPDSEQYVTRLSADGTTLVYSTFLTGSNGATNAGLAVDAGGNAYVTGATTSPDYPFTTSQPARSGLFLTKIDPTGSKILWSVQQGGNLLAMDNSGNLVVGGSFLSSSGPPFPPTGNLPAQCLPNGSTVQSDAYTQQFSSVDGTLLATRILAATEITASAMTVNQSGSIVLAGYSYFPDVPLTPGVVFSGAIAQRTVPGAYLAAFDFSDAPAAAQVSCALDAATMSPVGPVAPGQLLALTGYGLGPATGVSGNGASTVATELAGVQVTFDGVAAPLLYVSSGQINVQVPFEVTQEASTVMTVSTASGSVTRQFTVASSNPSVFTAIALNSDGTQNSSANPAQGGSYVTMFLNGVNASTGSGLPTGSIVSPNPSPLGSQVDVRSGTLSFAAGPLYPSTGSIDGVYQLRVQMPSGTSSGPAPVNLEITINGLPAGPFIVYGATVYQTPAVVWVGN
jgi:uncharacterized protein (TIGR03437 family)